MDYNEYISTEIGNKIKSGILALHRHWIERGYEYSVTEKHYYNCWKFERVDIDPDLEFGDWMGCYVTDKWVAPDGYVSISNCIYAYAEELIVEYLVGTGVDIDNMYFGDIDLSTTSFLGTIRSFDDLVGYELVDDIFESIRWMYCR